MITQELVKQLFVYENGILYWKVSRGNIKIGQEAGSMHYRGYIYIQIDKKAYSAHRIIFLYHYGYLPEFIDHKKGFSNKIENLRECTQSQNCQNRKLPKNNTSGIKGVYWHKGIQKWAAYITANNNRIHLGCFNEINNAQIVIIEARKKYHGEFANNGN